MMLHRNVLSPTNHKINERNHSHFSHNTFVIIYRLAGPSDEWPGKSAIIPFSLKYNAALKPFLACNYNCKCLEYNNANDDVIEIFQNKHSLES